MRIPVKCKPLKAACPKSDVTLPALQGGAIVCDRNTGEVELHVTDRYIAACIPVGGADELPEGVDTQLVSAEAVAAWTRSKGDAHITDDGCFHVGSAVFEPPTVPGGKYPNLAGLWPAAPARAFKVAFSAKKLAALADALGGEEVTVTFNVDRPLGSIVVKGKEGDGLLMPIRVNDTDLGFTVKESE